MRIKILLNYIVLIMLKKCMTYHCGTLYLGYTVREQKLSNSNYSQSSEFEFTASKLIKEAQGC